MITVSEVLQSKGGEVWSVTPETMVFDAVQLLAEKEIGALVVVEEDRPAGMLSERDYTRKVVLEGKSSKNTPVGDIMSRRVVCVGPQQSMEECMALMTDKHIRHLPVMDKGQLVGIVSIGDVVKAVISEKQFVIEQMEHYIQGK
ncbi:CBS domain-containing protein [Candidatus Sumerlaeota bacterium]|nr:CBS domain-containing protein [Candidatus Sumerlaeota bacterium]